MTYLTTLSTDIQEMIKEFHAAHVEDNLDPVESEEGAIHDAMHAYLGLGVTLEEEQLVLNCTNLLMGLDCSEHLRERCELLISLLPIDVLVELSSLFCKYK